MGYLETDIETKCDTCDGSGIKKTNINGNKVLAITLANIANKIQAIKTVRELYPAIGLKEAKDLVEQSMEYAMNMNSYLRGLNSAIKERQ